MIRYALVSPDGAIVEIRPYPDDAPPESTGGGAPGKPRLVPYLVEGLEHDPVAQVLDGPEIIVEATQVREVYTARPKTEDEVAAMRLVKKAGLEAEYVRRLYDLPGAVDVDGVTRLWHFDANGVTKVGHMLLMLIAGMIPSPQMWKPFEEAEVPVSQLGFMQLAGAYAARDRALFTVLQALKTQLAALDEPADVAAFDPLAGWE